MHKSKKLCMLSSPVDGPRLTAYMLLSTPESVTQLMSHDGLGEAWEVLNVGGSGELATWSNAVCHKPLKQHRLQLCTPQVHSCCMCRRATPDYGNPDVHLLWPTTQDE